MQGLMFSLLRKYVQANHSDNTWKKLLTETGLSEVIFVSGKSYPDEQLSALVSAASRLTGAEAHAILRNFGRFIVPDLVKTFGPLIKREWKTLDLIEHTERSIHTAIRHQNPLATPPEIVCKRVSPRKISVHYASPRKLCEVAKGIAEGVAEHYFERLYIVESKCMHRGDLACDMDIETLR